VFALAGCSSGIERGEVEAQGTSEVGQAVTAPGPSALAAARATDPNLKIAFVGDTADGNNWKSVLTCARRRLVIVSKVRHCDVVVFVRPGVVCER